MNPRKGIVTLTICLMLAAFPVVAEEKELGWEDVAELSYVLASGNSESSSFSFNNTASYTWEEALFVLRAGGLRVDSTNTTNLFAIDDGVNPISIIEIETEETTAELYFLNAQYDRNITEAFFWQVSAGWDRNELAGIKNRYSAFGGVGNIWLDDKDHKFRTSYGVTFTDQEDVVMNPNIDDSFLGARGTWNYMIALNDATKYGNDLIVNLNLDESDDWRADMVNWLSVKMNERLALKLSLTLFYDNLPALEQFNVYDDNIITNPGAALLGTSTREVEDLDTIFSAALVINF